MLCIIFANLFPNKTFVFYKMMFGLIMKAGTPWTTSSKNSKESEIAPFGSDTSPETKDRTGGQKR